MSAAAISSWYHTSRPSVMGTSPSTRLMTMTFSTVVSPLMATSALVLDGRGLGAAVALVGADEHLGAAVVDARPERLGAEAAEHHHVDGAEARAGEHHDRQLGDHRQVEGDAVALLDAVLLEHVGEPADLVEELRVGVRPGVAGVALEDDGGLVAPAGLDVAVEAVVARVELAALEPLDARRRGRSSTPGPCPTPWSRPAHPWRARPSTPRGPRWTACTSASYSASLLK